MRSILFIHGAFMTPLCWEKFIPVFRQLGYECHAPAWPYKDQPVSQLRESTDPKLATLGVTEIVDHYDRFIRALPSQPVLVGHSFGGLFVQMLLDRGLGAAGVAIDPAPPKGILPLYPSVARSLFPVLATPGGWRRIVRLSPKQFHYTFAHTLSAAELDAVYARYVTPETGRIFFQTASAPFHNVTRVDFSNARRAPLLLIAGAADHVCPARQIYANARKQKRSGAPTDYRVFPGRTHWLIGERGWEEVANSIADWLGSISAPMGNGAGRS